MHAGPPFRKQRHACVFTFSRAQELPHIRERVIKELKADGVDIDAACKYCDARDIPVRPPPPRQLFALRDAMERRQEKPFPDGAPRDSSLPRLVCLRRMTSMTWTPARPPPGLRRRA